MEAFESEFEKIYNIKNHLNLLNSIGTEEEANKKTSKAAKAKKAGPRISPTRSNRAPLTGQELSTQKNSLNKLKKPVHGD